MKLKKIIFIIIGCVSLGIGCGGIVLPILPTVPFFLLTVFCFANSSEKLHNWFVNTKMYKKHLDSFVKKKGMTVKTKVTILSSVTAIMLLGFILMMLKGIIIPSIILPLCGFFTLFISFSLSKRFQNKIIFINFYSDYGEYDNFS